jgi:hypothetical protein
MRFEAGGDLAAGPARLDRRDGVSTFKRGACAAIMLSLAALAHAQGMSNSQAVSGAPQPAPQQQVLASAQVPQADAAITRAQVRHDLVNAERDGQIQTLDRTLYAHH